MDWELILELIALTAFNCFWMWFLVYQPTQYMTKEQSKWGK